MIGIKKQVSINIDENIQERIRRILEVAESYGFLEIVKRNLTININEDSSKISYELSLPKLKFDEHPQFQMKILESGLADTQDLSVTKLQRYTYHGFHLIDPTIHFIRFDYEPFKKKFAPLHINAEEKIWGDHLVFPDDTNLDISKMSFPIALKVFERYAENKDDFPANQETNQPYVEIINKGART